MSTLVKSCEFVAKWQEESVRGMPEVEKCGSTCPHTQQFCEGFHQMQQSLGFFKLISGPMILFPFFFKHYFN
jgi:hypothetical protein